MAPLDSVSLSEFAGDALSSRQSGLLAVLQSLNDGETHRLRITCRGTEPWNVAVEAEPDPLGPEPGARQEQENPLDVWDLVLRLSEDRRLPRPSEAGRLKIIGLHARDADGTYMLRTRVMGGVVTAAQCRGLAELAATYGDGTTVLTTRANFQIRGIRPEHLADVLMALQDVGLTSVGAGANAVRTLTASPTSGLERDEVCDVRSLVRNLHHYILHHPELFGLPHKFNLAFDNGSWSGVFSDKNDVAFVATRVPVGTPLPAGIYFRVFAGAKVSKGKRAQAGDILISHSDVVAFAAAIVLLYKYRAESAGGPGIRLCDLIDKFGLLRVLEDAAVLGDVRLFRLPSRDFDRLPPPVQVHSRIGVFPQKQEGLVYLGVSIPVGRLMAEGLRELAELSERFGDGELRLSSWQDLIIPHVREESVEEIKQELARLGFRCENGDAGGSVVACSGLGYCPLAATDVKQMGLAVIERLRRDGDRGQPVNVNLNACKNACAHHTFGEIGLLGIKAPRGKKAYHLYIGHEGPEEVRPSPLLRNIGEEQVPELMTLLLQLYRDSRLADETFSAFARRTGRAALAERLRAFV